MKYFFVLLVSVIIISINKSNAQTYGLDNTDPSVFTKFRVPDTDLRSLWFNTNLNFNSNRTDNSGSLYSYLQALTFSEYSNLTYSLNPQYILLHESESNYLNFKVNLNGNLAYSFQSSKYYYNSYTSTSKQNQYAVNLSSNFTYDNYIDNGKTFYSAGAVINISMNDSKTNNSGDAAERYYDGTKNQDYVFSFGAGFGKIRNVTPVVSAIRFQERLKQLNMLKENLSDGTIEDLASRFYKQTYYGQVYDRSGKYFWQSVEKALAADGVSLNGLNMYAASYLMETVNEVRFLRQEGFMTGVNLNFDYTNNYYSSGGANYILAEQFFLLANVYINYSTQLDLNSQFNFNISLNGGPNLLAAPVNKQKYELSAGAGYSYEITDKLVTSVSDAIDILFFNSGIQSKHLTNTLNFAIHYFIEDHMSLNANYSWQYLTNKYNNQFYISTNKINMLNIGFTYYLERGFLFE